MSSFFAGLNLVILCSLHCIDAVMCENLSIRHGACMERHLASRELFLAFENIPFNHVDAHMCKHNGCNSSVLGNLSVYKD